MSQDFLTAVFPRTRFQDVLRISRARARIGERQTIRRVSHGRVEAADKSRDRVVQILGIGPALQLQVHVLVATRTA